MPHLSRHDLFKTRSVKIHLTMLVSVSHPMAISPVIEHVAPASAVTYTELSPVTEYVAPASAVTHAARHPAIEYVAPTPVVTDAAPSSVIEYVACAPVVFHAAPATVIERSALQRMSHEHEHTWKRRRKKDPMIRCTFFSCLTFPVFLFRITRPSNNFEISKQPVANPEHDFFPGNFLLVRTINFYSPGIILVIICPSCYEFIYYDIRFLSLDEIDSVS